MMKFLKIVFYCLVLFSCRKEQVENKQIINPIAVNFCNKSEDISFSKDLMPIINKRCINCHDVESSIKLFDYNFVLKFSQSGQLAGCLTGDDNYLQMDMLSKIDSCERKIILIWIKEGMQEN